MIRAISCKLRSPRGASMLLALLFLLICSMVTASILMAAAANAGKHRSNLEEHQIYLALSSAVSTLCDELNRSEYRGQYCSWQEKVHTGDDEFGNPTFTTYSYFKQADGAYTHVGTAANSYLAELLLADFDAIFAQSISLPEGVIDRGRKTGHLMPHHLAIAPRTDTKLDDMAVTLTLEVKETYAIYITAYLDEFEEYKLEAELTPNSSSPMLPPSLSYLGEETVQKTEPMKWKLGWITILDETEGGEAGS